MTDKQRLKIAIEALKSISAGHLPEADTKKWWIKQSVSDCVIVLSQDVTIARTALKEIK